MKTLRLYAFCHDKSNEPYIIKFRSLDVKIMRLLLPFSKWLILGIFRKNHKKHKKNTKTQKHKNVIAYVTQDLSNNNLSSFILKKNFTFIFRVCLFSLQNVVT